MSYLSTFRKVQVPRILMQFTSLVRNISVKADAKVKKKTFIGKHKDGYWISPPLTALRIEEIKAVTGIVTGLSYISWVKFSVPDLHLLDWNLHVLPEGFPGEVNDSSILAVAYDVKDHLPDSDLYVMESFSNRECRYHGGINKIKLSSMIMVLLNGISRGVGWKEKVIFQEKFVMNYLYDIQIASERISTRSIVENILLKSTLLADYDSLDSFSSNYPMITVDYGYVENYKQFSLEKQENLSLALLLTLSFIDVNLLRNQKSLEKIKKKRRKS